MEGATEDQAVALCRQAREQQQAVVSTPGRTQCRQCFHLSGSDPDRTHMARQPGCLGCGLMNSMRARRVRARTSRQA